MTTPLIPPKRKDPLKRTRPGQVTPGTRSRMAKSMAVLGGQGRFVLQTCPACATITYPPRDRCPKCWSTLHWVDQPDGGKVVAETTIRATVDNFFKDHLPWRTGTVQLDAGPVAIAHLHGDVTAGDRVKVRIVLDRSGNAALFALPEHEVANMSDDPQYRVFTASPKLRRVLVTDGRNPVGQEVARALVKAGASTVFLGNSNPLMRYNGQNEIEQLERLETVPLDLGDSRSVTELASQLGGRVDIIVNTASHTRAGGVAFGAKLTDLEIDLNLSVLGLLRLAQNFGPAMSGRSDDGVNSAAAIVDVAYVFGFTGKVGFSGMAASAAARLNLLHGLRGEMQNTGIRVISVLSGPLDSEWFQALPPPKTSPTQIAKAVVHALENGLETHAADEVAKDILARWQEAPLLTIREENR